MSLRHMFVASCFVVSLSCASLAEDLSSLKNRLFEERPAKARLFDCYSYADRAKFWPQRKASLQAIVDEYPNSQYADDAAVILACGRYDIEKDAEGAIVALNQVIKNFPDGRSILEPIWAAPLGCRFDWTWTRAMRSFSNLSEYRNTRKRSVDDRAPHIVKGELDALAYFNHLTEFPVYTRDIVRLYISTILRTLDRFDEAALELEKVTREIERFSKTVQEDYVAALEGEGNSFIQVLYRPNHVGYQTLVFCYRQSGKHDKALRTLDAYASVVDRGPNYALIQQVGDMYKEFGLAGKAREHYELALNTVNLCISKEQDRSERLVELRQSAASLRHKMEE